MNLCNELATRANATRVSLGWVKGKTIKVKALSHTEQFDKKQELVVLLAKVMEECMDQEAVVQYDPTQGGKSTDNVTRNAQQLSRSQGGHIVLSLPLRRKSDVIGVVTLEFLPTVRIGPHVANGLAIAVDLLAPQLYDRYTNDRWLITKAGISTREVAKATIGPKHMLAKLVAVLVVGVVLFSVLYRPMYKVTSKFQFVPLSKSTLAAGLDGKIGRPAIMTEDGTLLPPEHHDSLKPGERFIRPGDTVKAGQVLMKLDTQALEADLAKATAQMRQKIAEANAARSDSDPKSTAIALQKDAEAEAFQAQVDRLTLEIETAKVKSPIDGVLLKGDWVDKIGERVRQGDVLMEVGDARTLEAELYVDERDIQDVQLNQKGKLVTTSLPNDKYDFVVRRIVPMGEPKEGANVFKVYGTIQGRTSSTWRPGMAGEAKVEVRHEPVWWIYSHRLIDFVKLKLWL
jgi:multidrug efflux pump subunit AcrA (membrane-fusion protein)